MNPVRVMIRQKTWIMMHSSITGCHFPNIWQAFIDNILCSMLQHYPMLLFAYKIDPLVLLFNIVVCCVCLQVFISVSMIMIG